MRRALAIALLLVAPFALGSQQFTGGQYLTGTAPVTNEPFLIHAWVKRIGVSNTQMVVAIGDAGAANGNHAWELFISSSDVVSGRSEGTIGETVYGASIGNDTTNWHSLVFYTNGDTHRNTAYDGTEGTPLTGNVAVNSANVDVIRIGLSTQSGDATAPFEGRIAHVAVYNTTGLDASAITALIAALAAGDNPLATNAANLVSYWPLTDSGDLTDHKGANDLTGIGSPTFNADNPTVDAPPAGDATPDAFSFTDQTSVALSSTITSAAVTITGIDATIECTATGGTIDLNADGNFQATQDVDNNDQIRARHTSSGSYSTAVNTVVDCNGVSDTFTSTTEAESVSPALSKIIQQM